MTTTAETKKTLTAEEIAARKEAQAKALEALAPYMSEAEALLCKEYNIAGDTLPEAIKNMVQVKAALRNKAESLKAKAEGKTPRAAGVNTFQVKVDALKISLQRIFGRARGLKLDDSKIMELISFASENPIVESEESKADRKAKMKAAWEARKAKAMAEANGDDVPAPAAE